MKLVFYCLLVLVVSALITICSTQVAQASGGDLTRIPGQIILAAAAIGAVAILRKDFSANGTLIAASILLAGATGIAFGFGLYPLAVGGICVRLGAIKLPVSKESSPPVTVVCKLENVILVRRLLGHQSILLGFDKTLGCNLVELTVQMQMAPGERATILQSVMANPAVLDARIGPS